MADRKPKPPLTFREFVDMCKAMIEADFSRRLGAGNDPPPQLLLETNGKVTVVVFDRDFMASESSKEALAKLCGEAAKARRARKAAFAHGIWALLEPEDQPEMEADGTIISGARPTDHPNRVEAVMLEAFDPEVNEVWMARVERRGEKKRGHVREWNEDFGGKSMVDGVNQTDIISRFSEPILEALR